MPWHSVQARRWRSALGLALTIPAGLFWRLGPLPLGSFALKYGGSALWAAAVYWLVALLLPRFAPSATAGVAALLATGVECLKLVYWTPLDRFRESLAGKLLLGRHFTFGALLAYLLAITAAAVLEALWLRSRRRRESHLEGGHSAKAQAG